MDKVTLRELADMFKSLPSEIQDKPIGWLDIAYPTRDQIEEMKNNLLSSKNTDIQECAN